MACGTCADRRNSKTIYVHTSSSGVVKDFNTEVEAKAAVARTGGSYVKK
jgi:hypothetical protein